MENTKAASLKDIRDMRRRGDVEGPVGEAEAVDMPDSLWDDAGAMGADGIRTIGSEQDYDDALGRLKALMDSGQTETGRTESFEAAVELLLRAILQAAKADGEIDESERETILGSLGENTDPADAERVRAYLAVPLDIQGLADATPANQAPGLFHIRHGDHARHTPSEAVYLHRLAEASGLNGVVVNALHLQIGRPPLYRVD